MGLQGAGQELAWRALTEPIILEPVPLLSASGKNPGNISRANISR